MREVASKLAGIWKTVVSTTLDPATLVFLEIDNEERLVEVDRLGRGKTLGD